MRFLSLLTVKLWKNKKLKLYKNEIIFFKNKFIRNKRDYGLWTSIKKSTKILINPIYQKITYIIYELDLKNVHKAEINNIDYRFKMLTVEDDDFINQIENMEEWLKGSIKESLTTNGICFVITKKDKVAGFNWVTLGEGTIPLLKLRVIIKPDEAWSEQITIHKDFRRRGLSNILRTQFYRELKKMGIKALYGHRQVWNISSKMSARKYTYRELVKADYIKIFNKHRLRFAKLISDHPSEYFLSRDSKLKNRKRFYYIAPKKRGKYLFTCDISDLKV